MKTVLEFPYFSSTNYLKMKTLGLFFSLLISATFFAQYLTPPQIETPMFRVYMSPTGTDTNSGDSLNPVFSFSQALDLLISATSNETGEVYTEVALQPGMYTQALVQPISAYQLATKNLNVSVRGRGGVMMNGSGLTNLSAGSGMVHLLGSHIYVKEIIILNSPANGIRFGFNSNNTVINSGDILIQNVYVTQTLGHGILAGIGAVDNSNPTALVPKAKGFLIDDCYVTEAVNYNTPQPQWGSAIKAWNAKNVIIRNCTVKNNGGEGIDADDCDSIEIHDNLVTDNVVGIYLDKVTTAWVYSNHIENDYKQSLGILCAMEAFSNLISNYYIKDVHIYNNILLNTQGISFWQGTFGALQHGYFHSVEIAHNSIIGRQSGNGACINFSFDTFLGQPSPNVHFNQISLHRNLVAANSDSLNNNQLIIAPCIIPGFSANYNCYGQAVWSGMTSATDIIDPNIPASVPDAWGTVSGGPYVPLHLVPISSITLDYNYYQRDVNQTAVGALEYNTAAIEPSSYVDILVYPNPFKDKLTIKAPAGIYVSSIFDLFGKKLNANHVDMLEPGSYFIQFSNGTVYPIVRVE
jgi:parallel beta-helix repeat protein